MKLKDIRRLPTTAVRFQDTSGKFSPLSFPPLSGEEHMFLQGLVNDNLKIGRQPSTEQMRIIAKLMKLRLAKQEPRKTDKETRYRATPWGVELVTAIGANGGTKAFTAKSSPHA